MPRFTSDNTLGYEPAGIKLLNRIFDLVIADARARENRASEADIKSREDKIAQAILDVCYEDHGSIDAKSLAEKVLVKLGHH